jgi:septation ring formation regulator EzrA
MSEAQEQVNDILDMFKADEQPLSAIAEEVIAVEAQIEALDSKAKTLRDELIKKMEAGGQDAFKTANGLSVSLNRTTKISKAPDIDDESVFNWLRSNHYGDIIKTVVDSRTLSKTLSVHIDQGQALPSLFNQTPITSLRFNNRSKYLKGSGQ